LPITILTAFFFSCYNYSCTNNDQTLKDLVILTLHFCLYLHVGCAASLPMNNILSLTIGLGSDVVNHTGQHN